VVTIPAGMGCSGGYLLPEDTLVRDLLIKVRIAAIDGVGGILGQAGPCLVTFSGGIQEIRYGEMMFDSADVAAMLESGTFYNVILHEMGHILGIGSTWGSAFVGTSVLPVTGGFAYLKSNGNAGNVLAGFVGAAVVEDQGGAGTARAHWKEVVYDTELMTGFVDTLMPLSIITVRALQDLGYTVDEAAADAFSPGIRSSNRRRLSPSKKIALKGCLQNKFTISRLSGEMPKAGREMEFFQARRNKHLNTLG